MASPMTRRCRKIVFRLFLRPATGRRIGERLSRQTPATCWYFILALWGLKSDLVFSMPISKSELSHKLVVPAYRKFCRQNGLNFHFWDELPKGDFNLKVASAELELQMEAMGLFNALKPEYDFYEGNVISFRFSCWDGHFEHTSQPSADFLNQAAQNQRQLEKLERRLEVLCDLLAIFLGICFTINLFRLEKWQSFIPALIMMVLLAAGGCLGWRWWLIKQPRNREKRKHMELQAELRQLRNRLGLAHKALNVKQPSLTDQLEDKLGTALAEHIMARLGDEVDDPEMQRYVLHDINSLMLTAGPGTEIDRRHLKSVSLLESHLIASMQIPAQVLMKELPNRTAAWLAAEPERQSPERPQWAEEGRHLLDQARLNPSSSE